MSMRPIVGSGVSGMADWIHIGGKSTTLTPGERRILDKLRSGQTEAQIRHDLQIAIGELVDAIASIKSKGYSVEQVHERRTRKMTEEKIARAKELRAQGCTLSHIGRELGVSAVTVKNVLDKAKEEQEVPPAPAPEAPEERVPGSVLRCIQDAIDDKLRLIEVYEARKEEAKAELAELRGYARAYERG